MRTDNGDNPSSSSMFGVRRAAIVTVASGEALWLGNGNDCRSMSSRGCLLPSKNSKPPSMAIRRSSFRRWPTFTTLARWNWTSTSKSWSMIMLPMIKCGRRCNPTLRRVPLPLHVKIWWGWCNQSHISNSSHRQRAFLPYSSHHIGRDFLDDMVHRSSLFYKNFVSKTPPMINQKLPRAIFAGWVFIIFFKNNTNVRKLTMNYIYTSYS